MANLSNLNNKFLVTTGGNVLINKTAANNSTVGTQIMSTGDVNATVSGDTVARFNRLGTDGEIIRFQHDTSTDGAINSSSGRIAIGSSTTGIFFDSIRDVVTPHNMSTNTYSTNISLGRSVIPFKDLYLGGSAVFVDGAAYSSAASIRQQSSALIFSGGSTGYYFNKSDNSATHMFINSSGNVGIGTTSPSHRLHVVSTGNGEIKAERTSGAAILTQAQSALGKFGTTTNHNLQFMANSNGWMTVTTAGNVGIGTVSPGSKLHVKGDFVSIEDPSGGFKMELSADTDPVTIMSDNLTGAAYGQIAFVAGNGSGANDQERMRIDSSGRVGIGTTGLTRQLEVNTSGGWNNGISLNSSSGDGAGLRLNCSDTGGNEWYLISTGSGNGGGAGNLGFYNNTAGAYHMYITSGGKVGIGTTSPQVPLHVKSASSSETVRVQGANATGNNYLTFADSLGNIDAYIGLGSGADDRFLIVNFSDSPTYFYNKNGIKMTITNVGNVGIGTTSPNEILTVAGNVNITGTGTLLRWNSGDIQIRNAGSYAMAFDTYSGSALVERMRIVSGGYIGMNTSPSGFATLEIENIASTTYGLYVDYIDTNASYGAMKVILTGASTSPSYVDWWYGATQTGAVVTTGSSTQYLTSSDYRLKENIVPMSNAIDRVKQLKPSRFNFIGHENTVDGLIAHEVAEVVPEAVNGEKDGLRDDGTPKYQGIDEGKLVPLLIGAIQELEARLKELENK